MPWTKEHMETGEWSIGLLPETRRSVLDVVNIIDNAFATIAVSHVELDPDDYAGDFTAFLQACCWTGRFMEVSDGGLTIGGDGLIGWLGDENDGGDLVIGATTTSSAFDLEEQLDARIFTSRSNGLTKGTVNDNAQTRSISVEPGTTPRQFLDSILALYSNSNHQWEYRINTDGSVDVDRAGALWPTQSSPSTILSRDGGITITGTTDKFLALDGVGDYASTPDSVPLSITGDITCFFKVALDDYSSGGVQTIVSKWDTTGNQQAYRFEFTATGELQVFWSTNGTATASDVTSTPPSVTNGTAYWWAVEFDVVNGANKRVNYYRASAEGINDWRDVTVWEVEDSNTTAGTTSIANTTAPVRVGGIVGDTQMPTGKVYGVEIVDGLAITGSADVPVGDPYFSGWPLGDTSEPDSVGNTWTLSGNATISALFGDTITGLPAVMDRADLDVFDYRTAVYAGDPDTAIIGNASQSPPSTWTQFMSSSAPTLRSLIHSTPRHRFIDRTRRWSARVGASRYAAWTLTSAGQATNMATAALVKTDTYDFSVRADVDCFDVARFVDVGDTVYVWDFKQRLFDHDNELMYQGEPAHPKKLRVRRMEVPIQQGNGVYLITGGGTTITNITKCVDFEDGPATLELGTRGFFHRPNARPTRINRRRMARLARQRYRLARYLGGSV